MSDAKSDGPEMTAPSIGHAGLEIKGAGPSPVQMRPTIVPGFYGRLNVGAPIETINGTVVPVRFKSRDSFNHPAFVELTASDMRRAGHDLLRMAQFLDEQGQGREG